MFLKSIFGSANDRYLKKFKNIIEKINSLEPIYEKFSEDELKDKTQEYKTRIQNGESLDTLLPEAFASVREASKRVLGLRPFDVQLLGGIILHNGQIAEMRTGEGKTLVATMPVYLNALTGKGVHVVTVNDYLAKRDSEWMGQIYRYLGLSVGCITQEMSNTERRAAYNADITYATNNELGFDYLRDNMCKNLKDMVQRPFYFAIVDEVDSILIDEARTPLIISGASENSSERYIAIDKLVKTVKPEHYEKDEKYKNVTLTELGTEYIEQLLIDSNLIQGSLYDIQNIAFVHHIDQALKANTMYIKDKDYIVKNGEIIIIDVFTGRMMHGRRYSDGLHQAIEAKEGVNIQPENQTLASITFQNYFRLYPKLAGMTGTAMTEAGEFDEIYHLRVVEIPTNKEPQRIDENDVIYGTEAEKNDAIISEIIATHEKGQPILIGTGSIEKSEVLADLLKQRTSIPFNVLNARNPEQEAKIIAQAGAPGAVTIATNMAGRGTDIQLGGNVDMLLKEALEKDPEANQEVLLEKIKKEVAEKKEQVIKTGGLYVLGSERHESRRIDNQLRGRSGRQGDPGFSRFYVSLEDDLMRIFGAHRIQSVMAHLGLKKGEPIIHNYITKAISVAQKKVETAHFDNRKNVLRYDDVMNDQRKAIYEQRKELMLSESVSDIIKDMCFETVQNVIYSLAPERSNPEDWNVNDLKNETFRMFDIDAPFNSWVHELGITPEIIVERINNLIEKNINEKLSVIPQDLRLMIEKDILIKSIDDLWKEHLQTLDFMRTAINLRAYGQKNPLNEYKKEAFILFENLLSKIKESVTFNICKGHPQIITPEETKSYSDEKEPYNVIDMSYVSRNSPCPCGSGKKYKHCCGAIKF